MRHVRNILWQSLPFAIAVLLLALRFPSSNAMSLAVSRCAQPPCDFDRFYYPMAEQIFSATAPVEGYIYGPLLAITMAPLSLLTRPAAAAVWLTVLAVAAVLLVHVGTRLVPVRSWLSRAVFAVLSLTAYPLLHNLAWGQISILLVLLAAAALMFDQQGDARRAGGLLGLAISLKLYPIVYLLGPLSQWRWRTVVWMVVAALLLAQLVPALLMGAEAFGAFQKHQPFWSSVPPLTFAVDFESQYLPAVAVRWAMLLRGSPLQSAAAAARNTMVGVSVDSIANLAVVLVWLARAQALANFGLLFWLVRRDRAWAGAWTFALCSLSLPLLLPTSWPHYFVYLPICQLFVWQRMGEMRWRGAGRWMVWSLLAVSVFATNIVARDLLGEYFRYSYLGMPLVANLTALLATYALALRLASKAPTAITSDGAGDSPSTVR